MMLIVMPKPGARPLAASSAFGCHCPVITACAEGLGDCAVIQNHSPVRNAIAPSVATSSGWASSGSPSASPACP